MLSLTNIYKQNPADLPRFVPVCPESIFQIAQSLSKIENPLQMSKPLPSQSGGLSQIRRGAATTFWRSTPDFGLGITVILGYVVLP
ncbi:MAG: hypothetical protein ACLQDC_08335 [Verrucomicrobiia bacterium]